MYPIFLDVLLEAQVFILIAIYNYNIYLINVQLTLTDPLEKTHINDQSCAVFPLLLLNGSLFSCPRKTSHETRQ